MRRPNPALCISGVFTDGCFRPLADGRWEEKGSRSLRMSRAHREVVRHNLGATIHPSAKSDGRTGESRDDNLPRATRSDVMIVG